MRVGISLLTLVPGISGGSETYARELVRALGRAGDSEHTYCVFLPTIAGDVEGLPVEVVTEYRATRSTPGRIVAMARGWFAGGRLERHFADLGAVHFPLTVMVPRTRRLAVTTILDVQHELLPQFFSRAERAYRRLVYARSVRESERVVTISQHAATAIADRLGVPEEKLRPIHLGIDHEVFRPAGERTNRQKDGPPGEFLLYPARGWPHKNHARLFAAFRELRRRHPGLELVLTSYDGPVPDGVRSLGHVSRAELVALYQRAEALVFPSLYEGFGQPPLEAMACGCPVASSDVTSLPEVVGRAARLFDPTSVEDLIEAVEDVLANPGAWRARGLERAAAFSWDETARRHEAVYSELSS
ncbi:MAG: glycosyltransferase family 4 protein [Actinobacteria bacterium]|nr:glycosyltransferase family 4 protein [Actinomycetota bacterium]